MSDIEAIIEQAKKTILAVGHRLDCNFSGCTCGNTERFKIESGEFWRLIQQRTSAGHPNG